MQFIFQAIRKMTLSLKWKALLLLSAVCFAPTTGSADEPPWKNGRHTLTVDERKRTFILEIPPELKAGAPLVMVFHGTGGSAAAAQRDCGFSALIKRQNFVAVYPNAASPSLLKNAALSSQNTCPKFLSPRPADSPP